MLTAQQRDEARKLLKSVTSSFDNMSSFLDERQILLGVLDRLATRIRIGQYDKNIETKVRLRKSIEEAYRTLGEYQKGLSVLEGSLEEEKSDVYSHARLVSRLGMLKVELEDYEAGLHMLQEAATLYQEAATLYKEISFWDLSQSVLVPMARAFEGMGHYAKADDYRKRAYAVQNGTLVVLSCGGEVERVFSNIGNPKLRLRPIIITSPRKAVNGSEVELTTTDPALEAALSCSPYFFDTRANPFDEVEAQGTHGELLMIRGQFCEAEPLLLAAFADASRLRQTHGYKRKRPANRLVRLYEYWDADEPGQGHAAEAAKWRAKLENWEQEAGN